jgi:hypothetical protein
MSFDLAVWYPEIDDVPEERIDDHDWSRAEYVRRLVGELASKHGLVL